MEDRKTLEYFREHLIAEIKHHFSSEYLVETHEVVKNNDLHLESLTIREKKSKISPNFYMNRLYEKYRRGNSIEEIVQEIVYLYQESMQECENLDVDFTYENCKEKIVLRLVSGIWNQGLLEQAPHIPFMDMAILFYVVLRVEEEGIGSVRISSQLQEQWDISTYTLFTQALENSKRLFPEKICSMVTMMEKGVSIGDRQEFLDFLEQEYGEKENNMPLVITNTCGINGATVILYPDILKKIGEMFGRDYYLLPSSIHEFIAIPQCSGLHGEDLKGMVKEVNLTCVAREELLSDKVYYYEIRSGKINVWNKVGEEQ